MSHPSATRPLLPLLLAHQSQSWRQGQRVPVETYLAEQPGLRADVRSVLDLIYHEMVLREAAGECPTFAEYTERFPDLAPHLKLQWEVEAAIWPSPRVSIGSEETVHCQRAMPAVPPERLALPGYEILGELGRGGMGVVYRARQLQLNRIVALKMILAGAHAPPETAIRFMGEAESVARLHHPHIVQVHAFGNHEGHPYIEMEYVAGGSLSERLNGATWSPRDAARLIETLARAIQEVHRLGIVHRDLKPANLLLTADGSPKIADFGLAKWLDVETGLTRTDHIVGSPSYMAPEQAGGKPSQVGPAADVYALGAILYELLVGRPPFAAATILETLEQVRSVQPVPPRKLRPAVPQDLATICLKCLQKEPDKRYVSAEALAEDLHRFLHRQSISARPVSAPERLWQWCRREPALTALTLSLIAGLGGVATQWWRAEAHLAESRRQRIVAEASTQRQLETNRNLRLANAHVTAARRHAQERFAVAMKALRAFEAISSESALLREPEMEGVRQNLLRAALEFYRELQVSLQEDPSPGAQAELSDAYARIAEISWKLGLREEALATHRRALELFEQAAATKPDSPEIRAARATRHASIGFTLRTMGRPAEAARSYDVAREIRETLVREDPTSVSRQEALSWTYSNLGAIQQDLGHPAEATRLHQRAMAIYERLVQEHPENPHHRSEMAWCWRYLSLVLLSTGDLEAGLRLAEQAADLHEALVAADRQDVEFRWRLARCLDLVGRIQTRSGRSLAAAQPLERSAELYDSLAQDNPVLYRLDIARNQLNLAYQRALANRRAEAMVNIRTAESLLSRSPLAWPELLYDLACAHSLLSRPSAEDEGLSGDREQHAQQAVATLALAFTAGYDIHHNPQDRALESLHSRRDFQQVMQDATFPADAFAR